MRHRVLDIQQTPGAEAAGRVMNGIARDRVYVTSSGSSAPMLVQYTPPVDCWWKVTFNQSNVAHNSTDAWRWCYFFMHCFPPPANFRSNQSTSTVGPAGNTVSFPDGMTAGSIVSQVTADTYHFRQFTKLWDLKAGIPYTCQAGYQTQDAVGSWSYHCGPDHMWMHGIAIEK